MSVKNKFICWNCPGTNNGQFLREIKEMIRSYKPLVLILLEPKVSGLVADEVCYKIGFNRWCRSEAGGFS